MKKMLQVLFDFIFIFILRAVICFLASVSKSIDLTGSEIVWIVSILCGLVFAEFFEVRRKKEENE